ANSEEAVMVDRTTRFGAFLRILLPPVGPGLVATSIFAFIPSLGAGELEQAVTLLGRFDRHLLLSPDEERSRWRSTRGSCTSSISKRAVPSTVDTPVAAGVAG